jgi:hypothetical protein
MTFEEWFETYEYRHEPEAEKHCRAAWDRAATHNSSDEPYVDSRIMEMNRRLYGES